VAKGGAENELRHTNNVGDRRVRGCCRDRWLRECCGERNHVGSTDRRDCRAVRVGIAGGMREP